MSRRAISIGRARVVAGILLVASLSSACITTTDRVGYSSHPDSSVLRQERNRYRTFGLAPGVGQYLYQRKPVKAVGALAIYPFTAAVNVLTLMNFSMHSWFHPFDEAGPCAVLVALGRCTSTGPGASEYRPVVDKLAKHLGQSPKATVNEVGRWIEASPFVSRDVMGYRTALLMLEGMEVICGKAESLRCLRATPASLDPLFHCNTQCTTGAIRRTR